MTDHTAREVEPTVARPIIDRLDPSLAPGCYGSSFCFHEDAPECMSCPFINTCRPLAAELMAAIGAKYGVVPKVHKDPLDAHGRHFEVVEPPNEEVSAEQAWNREELSGWRSWELKKRADRDGKRAEREAKKEDQRAAEQARAKGAVTIVNAIRAEAKSRLALLKRATAAEHLNKSSREDRGKRGTLCARLGCTGDYRDVEGAQGFARGDCRPVFQNVRTDQSVSSSDRAREGRFV